MFRRRSSRDTRGAGDGHGVLRRETRHSGAGPENARPASSTWQHASPTRDYEYQRLGTVSLLAGLDLHRGTVTEIVSETHKSKDFIELLKKLDAAYPTATTLRLILDNHSAHISKETQRYLASRPQRFQFVFVPKHGSWLNLVENMFSKMARSMLREIRVQSKQELVQRIHLYFQEVNAIPVVFRWKYKMDEVSID